MQDEKKLPKEKLMEQDLKELRNISKDDPSMKVPKDAEKRGLGAWPDWVFTLKNEALRVPNRTSQVMDLEWSCRGLSNDWCRVETSTWIGE